MKQLKLSDRKKVKFTKPQREEISFQIYVRIDSDAIYHGVIHEFENSVKDMENLAYDLARNKRDVFTDMEIEYMILLVEYLVDHLYSNECWGGVRSLNNAIKKMEDQLNIND